MNLTPVISSMITAIGHDAEKSQLHVQFTNGQIYAYNNVNTDLYTNLMAAPSVGSFFSANIKKFPEKYPFDEVPKVSSSKPAKPAKDQA